MPTADEVRAIVREEVSRARGPWANARLVQVEGDPRVWVVGGPQAQHVPDEQTLRHMEWRIQSTGGSSEIERWAPGTLPVAGVPVATAADIADRLANDPAVLDALARAATPAAVGAVLAEAARRLDPGRQAG